MTSFKLNQGDLLAHLDGERVPHFDVALRYQPELGEQLDALREADQFFHQRFGRILRPDSQDLVDVVTGQASRDQELRVAAYLRQSAAGRAEMAGTLEAFAKEQRILLGPLGILEIIRDILDRLFGTEWRFWGVFSRLLAEMTQGPLRQFFALPLQVAGVRGTRDLYSEEPEDTFYVAELDARVTVYRSPSVGEEWIIEGYVTQREEPMDGITATLEENDEIIASTESEGGFFTFEAIEAGTYHIKVHLEQGILITPEIELKDE
jgi:hypothetical protein